MVGEGDYLWNHSWARLNCGSEIETKSEVIEAVNGGSGRTSEDGDVVSKTV